MRTIALILLLGFSQLSAQNQTNWQAHWIWQQADGPQNTWMCFRKTIDISSKPTSVKTFIAAESKYWLYINGQMVVFEGQLKNSLKQDTYYDELDLAPFLQQGTNSIAALVWHFGKDGFSHRNTGKGGFLFEADLGGTKIISDSSWNIKVHPANGQSSGGGQPNMRMSESNILYDAGKMTISGWTQPVYDDSGWDNAVQKGMPPISPWNIMVKRPFPLFKDFGLKEYTNAGSLPTTGKGGVVEAILPYNMRVSVYLKVKASAGKIINIQTDQYDGWYDFGEGPGLRTEYITKDGEQEFETLMWTSGNSVQYTIPEGVEIISLKYRELGYPAEFTGSFTSSDPFYDTLWSMARRTLYINMYDNFMDCPDRERALWWGDVVNQSGEVYYTLDTVAHGLIKKAITTLTDWQRDDSTMFCPPSVLWSAELPQQILASVGQYGFWNYFMNTNDSLTIQKAYPTVRKYMGIWKMKGGLVEHRSGAWDWADWGKNADIAIMDNAWYYMALKAAIPMATMSGYATDTAEYSQRMKSIEANFDNAFWKIEDQHYRSSALSIPDDRGNAMAVIAGLAKSEYYSGITKVLKEQQFASPYMEKYVLEALCKMNEAEESLQRMKTRYTQMVNSQYTTLWEVWNGLSEGTINHGWNAPNTVLSQCIAGVAPTKPGWSEFSVMPRLGGLSHVSQIVPTVKGDVKVRHQLSNEAFTMDFESPADTKAIIGIPKSKEWKVITINDQIVWKKGKYSKSNFAFEDDASYYKFWLDGGKWKIEASKQ